MSPCVDEQHECYLMTVALAFFDVLDLCSCLFAGR